MRQFLHSRFAAGVAVGALATAFALSGGPGGGLAGATRAPAAVPAGSDATGVSGQSGASGASGTSGVEAVTLAAPQSGRDVTLVTGDRVVLSGSRVVGLQPAPGRSGIPLRSYTQGGRLYAVPLDQEPLINTGKVDPALFAVGTAAQPAAAKPVAADTPEYTLTLKFVGRNGRPAAGHYEQLTGLADGQAYTASDSATTATLKVPQGRYYLEAGISATGTYDFFSEPTVTVDGDSTLTLDARDARPLGFKVDQPGADGVATVATDRVTDGGAHIGSSLFSPLSQLRMRPSRSDAPGQYTLTVQSHLGRPDGHGTYAGSPYQYHLQWVQDGKVPADLTRRFRDADLATVRSIVAAQRPGASDTKLYSADVQVPGVVIEHNTPGAQFFQDVYEITSAGEWNWALSELPYPEEAGSSSTEQWNMGPFGPSFASSPDLPQVWCTRVGDQLNFSVPQFSDQTPNHFGFSATTSQVARLLMNGKPYGSADTEFGIYTVPPAGATFTYSLTEKRDVSPFSTEVDSSWTFPSGHVGASPVGLAMTALRFAPALDQFNRAPGGQEFKLPLFLQAQFGNTLPQTRRVTVDVSYDDGKTWTRVPVTGGGADWTATLHHPDGTGYVSLRGTATDVQGGSTSVTIIHAYQLK